MAAGGLFVVLNTLMRALAIALDPFQTQFLRYLGGLVVLLPLVARSGWAAYRPKNLGGQFCARCCPHLRAVAVVCRHPSSTTGGYHGHRLHTPIFIMLGAWLVFASPCAGSAGWRR
jgi:hypothetical protein